MTATRPERMIVVRDDATRPEIEAAIELLSLRKRRMPKHWEDRRLEVADEIDGLVDRWILAGA